MKGLYTYDRPLARNSDIVVQENDGEVLVYDVVTNKAHCLNDSAAMIWRSCDGTNSVDDIVKKFESEGRGSVTSDFVWLAIDELQERKLMEGDMPKHYAGMSRRQVIKKVGMASAVALPVIASLAAPQNALATASCACVAPGDCAAQAGCPSTVNCNPSGVCAP